MDWQVPLFATDFGSAELEAVQKPVRWGWLTMAEVTQRLEREFAARCDVKHAIAVTNCTAALHLAVAAAGIGPGDEVLCPTLTFVATANAICYVGARPVFCDSLGDHNLNVGVETLSPRITSDTRGIMVVHYAGFPVDMPSVLELARKHNLVVIEDCAHALFSTLHGRACGSWGLLGAFSFFGNKNMTCGEGGMVVTDDDVVADRVRNMRSHGMTTLTLDRYQGRAFTYDVTCRGYNYRLDEIRSSLALAQLGRLDSFLVERERVRRIYCENLQGSRIRIPDFDWPRIAHSGDRVGHHIMPVLLPEGCNRPLIAARLKEKKIQSSVHYRPVHTFAAFQESVPETLRPVKTGKLADRELTLPMYPTMTDEQVKYVCKALLETVGI